MLLKWDCGAKIISMMKAILFLYFFMFGRKKLKWKYKWRLKFASWIFTISVGNINVGDYTSLSSGTQKTMRRKQDTKYGLYYQKMVIWRNFLFQKMFWNLIMNILNLKYCKFWVWSSNFEPIASGFCLAKWMIIQLKYLINGN